ncbi:MAG: hypothetical protein KDI16_14555 [Halioglobus sp.]|nr:hypothetical protein [Halioglobus sp.]
MGKNSYHSNADSARLGHRLTTRYDIDNFIIGLLIMFLCVYALELMILIPCGSFHDIVSCDLPPSSEAFWRDYFNLDPLFLEMPPWLVTVMSIQDYLFNPWWVLSLFMFWTGRQEANWYRTSTVLVCGIIIGTTAVTFGVQSFYPHYTTRVMAQLVLINGPWIVAPLLYAWRLRHTSPGATPIYRKSGTRTRAIVMMLIPTLIYFSMSAVRRML